MTLKIIQSPLGLIDDVTGAFRGVRTADVDYLLPIFTTDSSGAIVGSAVVGTLLAANGVVTAPAYSFVNDPDSGWYRFGADDYRFSADGVDSFRLSGANAVIPVGGAIAWGSVGVGTPDLFLRRDAANTLAQRNGTAAQSFRLYNTFTDASNYERGVFDWTTLANVLAIGTQKGGTGSTRSVGILVGGTLSWLIDATAFKPATNGSFDFGAISFGLKRLYIDYTNTATVGAVTINKAAGRVNIAASGTSVVVTNSLVTAASHVLAIVSQNDATAQVLNVVPAAGSFTITLQAAATAQVSIDFFVINAD